MGKLGDTLTCIQATVIGVCFGLSLGCEEIKIFDKDVNMLNLKSTQAIKIENDSYSIVESSTIEKKSKNKVVYI